MRIPWCVLWLPLLLSACATAPDVSGLAPLPMGGRVPFTCEGRLGPGSLELQPVSDGGLGEEDTPAARPVIEVEVLVLELSPAGARALRSGETGLDVVTVQPEVLSSSLQRLSDAGLAPAMECPRVTCFAGQQAEVSVIVQRAHVGEWLVQRAPDGDRWEPRILIANEGLRVHLQPTPEADGAMALALVIEDVRLLDPMLESAEESERPMEVPLAFSQRLTIESPLAADQAFLILGLQPEEQPSARWIAVTARERDSEDSSK